MVQATRFHRRKRLFAAHNDDACEVCSVQLVHRVLLGLCPSAALHVARLLPSSWTIGGMPAERTAARTT
jgi:hypothetical protein